MSESNVYSVHEDDYFGVTHLNMGSYAAHLIVHRLVESRSNGSHLYFDEAQAMYDTSRRALTIEGNAGSLSTPGFAINSLESYARIAREMDALVQPYAS
jgi:hypothetical protein